MQPLNHHLLPAWAPRVKQHLIRRLYENDSKGIYDDELIDEVGWGLHARCISFITAVEATRGRVACPVCETIIPRDPGASDLLHCPECGWEHTWQAYFKTIQHRQLSGAEPVIDLFRGYVARYPGAKTYEDKMLLIDSLIHGFHWYEKFGNTRAVAVNLIDGSLQDVIALLDSLACGPSSTPGVQQQQTEWREKLNQIEVFWQQWRKVKGASHDE